jgi:type IV secretory pathway TraG/TraD family ATPase VirD4
MSDSLLSKMFRGKQVANEQPKSLSAKNPEDIFWAFRHLPIENAPQHFMVIGSTGSGKTVVFRMLMNSVLPQIALKRKTKRAFVYDGKREYVSLVYGMKPACDVFILNPFDERGYAWDISADVTSPRHAYAIASILIPDEPNTTQRFFPDAARMLLSTVMIAFAIKKQKANDKTWKWTLRDLILSLRSAEQISAVVEESEITESMASPYLNDEHTMPAILSTLATKLAPFEIVAALWQKTLSENNRCLSLKDWLASESILIVSSSPSNRASLDPINQVIFRRLSDLLLESENEKDELTWFFMDELREAGKLDGLSSLLNQGRSKGAAMVIGFQEIEGLEHVYTEKVANEICGQCAHKTFLRTNSQKTATWVQGHCGEVEKIEPQHSHSDAGGKEGGTHTDSVAFQLRTSHAVLASEVMMFPLTGPANGLTGIYDVPNSPLRQFPVTWSEVESHLGKSATEKEHANFCAWKKLILQDELVKLWDRTERKKIFNKEAGNEPVAANAETEIPNSKIPSRER